MGKDDEIRGIKMRGHEKVEKGGAFLAETITITGEAAALLRQAADKQVSLKQPERTHTEDQALWIYIRNRTDAISFKNYNLYIKKVFGCQLDAKEESTVDSFKVKENDVDREVEDFSNMRRFNGRFSINSFDSYNVLKLATEVFLLKNLIASDAQALIDAETDRLGESDVGKTKVIDKLKQYLGENPHLPYLEHVMQMLDKEHDKDSCQGILKPIDLSSPLMELIWSYWLEEGMLVQSINAIARRFQNKRGIGERDPFAELEISPLRPLNNLLWGYIQNEHNRLMVARRAYEYDHQYGISLYGKAVPKLNTADSRSKFLPAFHGLLHRASVFFKDDANTTVIADAFPLLKAIREVHLILAEGAHNQFGDLPWTARVEMMVEKWLLARPETRQFIAGRSMVPYNEDWMTTVDAIKRLQGWNDVTVTHFYDLATYGEQVLLSIRYGDWMDTNIVEQNAKNWARYWKSEIQSYIHGYKAVTGVDLTIEPVDATPPWVYLKRQEDMKPGARF